MHGFLICAPDFLVVARHRQQMGWGDRESANVPFTVLDFNIPVHYPMWAADQVKLVGKRGQAWCREDLSYTSASK